MCPIRPNHRSHIFPELIKVTYNGRPDNVPTRHVDGCPNLGGRTASNELFVDVLDVERVLAQIVSPMFDHTRLEHFRLSMRRRFAHAVDTFICMKLDEDPILPGIADDEGLDVCDGQNVAFRWLRNPPYATEVGRGLAPVRAMVDK